MYHRLNKGRIDRGPLKEQFAAKTSIENMIDRKRARADELHDRSLRIVTTSCKLVHAIVKKRKTFIRVKCSISFQINLN